jgi:hypothetical protein
MVTIRGLYIPQIRTSKHASNNKHRLPLNDEIMKEWPYVSNNPKHDACEEPKLVYNRENNTLVPKVGNETSDEDVWNASNVGNASSMRMQMTRMQVMRMWVTT